MKMCNACGETKPYSEFNRNSETYDGYRYTCKVCRRNKVPTNPTFTKLTRKTTDSYSTRISRENQDPVVVARLRKYGLSPEQFLALHKGQKGLCAICEKELGPKYCIDHCHSTGAVRGLLCYSCNSGIGLLNDSPERLRKALEYLMGKTGS